MELKGIDISGDTLRKVFQKWTNKNVFEIAYNIIIDIYKDRKIDFTDLFIDASNIKNYMGSELTGVNHCDKFKLATKLSIITDDLGVPVSIHLEKCNVHDIKLVVPNLEKIKIDTESAENLIADKGYISKTLKQYISEKYKMRIITPEKNPKKGVKKKSSENDKIKLRKRYIVEHTFSWIKNYTRLFRRKDKKISMYVSFMFFGICNITANKMEKYIIK